MSPELAALLPADEVDAEPADAAALERRWDLLTRQSAQVEPARDVVVTCPCGRHFGLRRREDGRVVRADP